MKRFLFALALVTACDKKPAEQTQPAPTDPAKPTEPAPGPQPTDPTAITGAESVARVTKLVDTICACPDRACAVAAREAMDAENKANGNRPRAKPTAEEAQLLTQQASRIMPCMARLK